MLIAWFSVRMFRLWIREHNWEDYYREDWRLREASGAWGKCETSVETVMEIVQCRKRLLKLDIAN